MVRVGPGLLSSSWILLINKIKNKPNKNEIYLEHNSLVLGLIYIDHQSHHDLPRPPQAASRLNGKQTAFTHLSIFSSMKSRIAGTLEWISWRRCAYVVCMTWERTVPLSLIIERMSVNTCNLVDSLWWSLRTTMYVWCHI